MLHVLMIVLKVAILVTTQHLYVIAVLKPLYQVGMNVNALINIQ